MAPKAQRQFSIAEARNSLGSLVHRSEEQGPIELTRRGRAVAVILSVAQYRRLAGKSNGLWSAIDKFRREADPADLPKEDIFADVRGRGPGREFKFR